LMKKIINVFQAPTTKAVLVCQVISLDFEWIHCS
jgi:hypothetical protein